MRKTTFIQNVAKYNLFGEFNEIFWISNTPLSSEREKNISICFRKYLNFKYPQTIDELNMHLTFFERKRQVYCLGRCWDLLINLTTLLIFPGSIQTFSVIKILSSYCNRYTYEYIPHGDLWLNRLYFEISNSFEKKCLAIDVRHANNLGLSKFRTGAENDK